MLHDYHIFEMFPDGSSVWRVCTEGRFTTERKLQELAERSGNEFIALDFSTLNYLRLGASGNNFDPKIKSMRSIDSLKASFLSAPPGPRAHIAMAHPERRRRGT